MPVNDHSPDFYNVPPAPKARVAIAISMTQMAERPKNRIGNFTLVVLSTPDREPLLLSEGVEAALYVWRAAGKEVSAVLGILNIALASEPDHAMVAATMVRDSWQHLPSRFRDV